MRLAEARGLSGVRWCRKCRHGRKTGVGCEVEGGLSAPCWRGCRSPGFVGTSRVAGSPVLAEVLCRCIRRWRVGFGFRGGVFAGKCHWSRRHIAASVPVCGSFAKSLSVGLFARQFSATCFEKGDDVRGKGAPKIEAVILIAIPPKHRRHTVKNRAACFAGW